MQPGLAKLACICSANETAQARQVHDIRALLTCQKSMCRGCANTVLHDMQFETHSAEWWTNAAHVFWHCELHKTVVIVHVPRLLSDDKQMRHGGDGLWQRLTGQYAGRIGPLTDEFRKTMNL